MKLSGFTFVRNGVRLGYPFLESLQTLKLYCDEVVIAVGNSDDETLELVHNHSFPELKVVTTIWDDNKRKDGFILAEQTNIALSHCTGDWCLYLQGDEILHESQKSQIRNWIEKANTIQADSLLFNWFHFYGSYDFLGVGRQWYRREIRAFRNQKNVVSWKDAQGFRKKQRDGGIEKLTALNTDLDVYHYGWVRNPRVQMAKQHAFQRLYHNDAWMLENIPDTDEFDYMCYEVARFKGQHPSVMRERIDKDRSWTKNYDHTRSLKRPILVQVTDWIEKRTGYRIGEYKNFIEVK